VRVSETTTPLWSESAAAECEEEGHTRPEGIDKVRRALQLLGTMASQFQTSFFLFLFFVFAFEIDELHTFSATAIYEVKKELNRKTVVCT
jgi:hypothetical protein